MFGQISAFGRISRGVRLAVLAVVVQALYLGCSAGDEPGKPEPVASITQNQIAEKCECVNSRGEADTILCADSCFKTVSCGSPTEPCASVCVFKTMTNVFDGCEAVGPGGDYKGYCASGGVNPGNRAGCCASCMTKDGFCGGPSNPTACGESDTCEVCPDKDREDCWLPTCKGGKCVGDETPAPVGNACVTPGGDKGRCATGGLCCAGCLTPGGSCVEGNTAGACGTQGAACMNCDNGKACDGAEQCKGGSCVAGTPLKCDDNDPCTADTCDDATGCQNQIDTTLPCSDGDGCTENDACHADGSCSGTPITCDDGNDCTADSCAEGRCVFVPANDNAPCEDGSSCTEGTTCNAGVCVASGATVCHDTENPCKASSCGDDGQGDCVEVDRPDGTPCDDGNPCTTADSCQEGMCKGGGDTDCDDGNPCTDDDCDESLGCFYVNATGECADGNLCTVDDRCQDGECVGEPVDCPAANECTLSGLCDEASGLCSLLLVENGTECGNGGECQTGQCVDEDPVGSGGTSGSGGSSGNGGTDGDVTNSGGTSGNGGTSGAANNGSGGSTNPDSGGSSAGGSSGNGGSSADSGGAGGTGNVNGAGGSDASGGSSSLGGSGGTVGSAGTYSGDDFEREAQGCACRTAPGGDTPSHAGLGLLGLGAMLGGRLRRRKRAG